MMDYVTVVCNGRLLDIPEEDINSPSKVRWWMNVDDVGDSPLCQRLASKGWYKYRLYTGKIQPLTWQDRFNQFIYKIRVGVRRYCWNHAWALTTYYKLAKHDIRI